MHITAIVIEAFQQEKKQVHQTEVFIMDVGANNTTMAFSRMNPFWPAIQYNAGQIARLNLIWRSHLCEYHFKDYNNKVISSKRE